MASLPLHDPARSELPSYELVDSQDKMASPMLVDSATPAPRESHTSNVFSMDDIEVAKALTGLREVSPSSTVTIQAATMSPKSAAAAASDQESQPLLTLLTSQHPLIASTINNSLSAYTTSKSYSTPFRVGAEFVERNIAQPVANTVGSASRMTGVETGVRWWLGRNESGDQTATSSNRTEIGSKRRRDSNEMDTSDHISPDGPPLAHRHRGFSELSQPEYLPPYDDQRSPKYEEYVTSQVASPTLPEASFQNSSWQTRLAIHTSGLGVAMSDESLKSLKYCLTWLRWANGHLSGVLRLLQETLTEWEQSQKRAQDEEDSNMVANSGRAPRDPAVITRHIQALKGECIKVLKNALDVVSKYAGGSLPENAQRFVRSQLTSLPARFRIATQDQSDSASSAGSSKSVHGGDEESQQAPAAVTGAQRVVVLAKEGLDMIHQVTAVVDGTIVSAEEWIEKLGRRRQPQTAVRTDDASFKALTTKTTSDNDTVMTAVSEKTQPLST